MFRLSRIFTICVCLSLISLMPTKSYAGKGAAKAIGIGAGLLMLKGIIDHKNKKKKKVRKKRKTNGGGAYAGAGAGYYSQQNEDIVVNYNRQAEIEALQKRRRNFSAEQKRNVLLAVNGFIATLRDEHQKLRRNGKSIAGLDPNQVTQGEIERVVDEVYKVARLFMFDRYSGEIWTPDRLKVQIINEANKGLPPYFNGVASKGPSMNDLRVLFQRSAHVVYGRALEISEIIGVSYSFDRFIRTIYENSDLTPKGLMVLGADGHYERILSKIIDLIPRQAFIQDRPNQQSDHLGLERQFQYRFRARRSLYDCLSAHYKDLISGKAPKVTKIVDLNSRGAKLAQQTEVKIVKADNNSNVWDRTNQYLRHVCSNFVKTLADAANAGQLSPVPARWDASIKPKTHKARPWEKGNNQAFGNNNQMPKPVYQNGNQQQLGTYSHGANQQQGQNYGRQYQQPNHQQGVNYNQQRSYQGGNQNYGQPGGQYPQQGGGYNQQGQNFNQYNNRGYNPGVNQEVNYQQRGNYQQQQPRNYQPNGNGYQQPQNYNRQQPMPQGGYNNQGGYHNQGQQPNNNQNLMQGYHKR